MKQKKIGNKLYVYSEEPYVITEDTDVDIIYVQEEVINEFKEINIDLIDKFDTINYNVTCVTKPEWADYYNDFTVYVEQTTGGTVTAYPTSGDEGEEIQVSHISSETYVFEHWDIVDEDGNDIEVNNGKFLMPASNVTVSATFVQKKYSVSIDQTTHGTVTSDKQSAYEDETITLTVTSDTGYSLNELIVVDEDENDIEVINNQFIMPASNVTVSATFIQTVFSITINDTEHGTITSDKQNAARGEIVTLTITPDAEYELDLLNVIDANSNPITVTNNQFIMPSSDVTVSATFKQEFTITINNTTHGSVTSDKYIANQGEVITLTITPDSEYRLDSLTVLDRNSNPITVTNNQFIMPASNVTVSAVFSIITYDITIEQTTHGTVTSNKQTAAWGETVTLTVNPDTDYILNQLTVVDTNYNPISVINNQFLMPSSDVIVNATFSQIEYAISIDQTTHGSVSTNKQIATQGETITLIITPDADYELNTLTVVDANSNPITVTNNQFIMPRSNVYIDATFNAITYTISVGQTTHGTVTSNKQTASVGETVTLTVNPDTNYELNTLTVVDANGNNIPVINNQFTMVRSNITVSATFSMITYTISVGQTTHGTVTSNKQTASLGETVTLTITPDSDYELNTLTVVDTNDNPITVTNNQFVMPSSDVTVSATFSMITYTISVGQTTHGTVTSNKQTASLGETVTLTINPDTNYELDTLTVVDANSNPITVTNNQFIMPASNVTVSAAFIQISYDRQYLTIESQADNNTISWKSNNESYTQDIQYSADLTNWTTVTSTTSGATLATLNNGDKLYLKGSLVGHNSANYYEYFTSLGNFKVYGNIMSLTNEDNFVNVTTLTHDFQFQHLFRDSKITDASNLILPATTLTDSCYRSTFRNCTSLTTVPELPATILIRYCYAYMFNGCTSLTTTPALPATTLTDSCYRNMFNGCTSLTTAPVLPATTLANYCYSNMFNGCTSLTTAPELNVTTLAPNCYDGMFNGCTSLTTAPVLPATTLIYSCYSSMFSGCTSLTTAPALPATTLVSLCYSNMFQGCTLLTSAPELPATTLTQSCYYKMFNGCTSLNSITMLATDISASLCLTSWVSNVSATGTFTKAASMTTLPTGQNGIPSGWTVVDA